MKKIAITLVALFGLFTVSAYANKTSVEIKAPAEVKVGTEVTIVVNVMHSSNSKGHHTDWVYLKINGKEVKRWEYTKTSLPSANNFAVEFKYTVTEPLIIEAEGHCNLHGSAGLKKITIKTT
jgi:desulfoferrodoxin (superoxide reductase-like protein)